MNSVWSIFNEPPEDLWGLRGDVYMWTSRGPAGALQPAEPPHGIPRAAYYLRNDYYAHRLTQRVRPMTDSTINTINDRTISKIEV